MNMKPHLVPLVISFLFFANCTADPESARTAPGDDASAPVIQASEVHTTDHITTDHIIVQPGTIDWQAGPPSMEPGAEAAAIEGDPSQPGFFNLRLRMPDGYRIAPHTHPQPERVTVISGTFLLGEGDQVDDSAMHALQPGSYFSMPPGMTHFARTQGETVIQLTSMGPWSIEYVNPEDDPRLR